MNHAQNRLAHGTAAVGGDFVQPIKDEQYLSIGHQLPQFLHQGPALLSLDIEPPLGKHSLAQLRSLVSGHKFTQGNMAQMGGQIAQGEKEG